jgi:hypothetical protein
VVDVVVVLSVVVVVVAGGVVGTHATASAASTAAAATVAVRRRRIVDGVDGMSGDLLVSNAPHGAGSTTLASTSRPDGKHT